MLFLYRTGIALFGLLMRLAALWHPKARLWVQGRKRLLDEITDKAKNLKRPVWFHFASLGEFEQGRPVMEALKKAEPDTQIIITFFSPSGYEIRKNYALADAVFYLPLDTPENAAEFIRLIKPKMAVFTKYEYWYFFFRELAKNQIPLYIISGIFRPNQVFFKWYGGLHRRMLGFVKHFFVQNEESKTLLAQLGHQNITVAGDTRFDRVAELASNRKDLPEVAAFAGKNKVMVAGSTWPQDEALLVKLCASYPDWKFIIAPHEVDEAHIDELYKRFSEGHAIRHSKLFNQNSLLNTPYSILVIDKIGLLSSLYTFADVAYIGGGFGKGIHNTLEAAAYGVPVIFGPNYQKFQEAKDLISASAGFSINHEDELQEVMAQLQNEDLRRAAGKAADNYVHSQVGATELILNTIKVDLLT